jgi:hypothetical protein
MEFDEDEDEDEDTSTKEDAWVVIVLKLEHHFQTTWNKKWKRWN